MSAAHKNKLAWMVGTWFGCGFAPVAPGTVGTIGALPLYFVLRHWGTTGILLGAIAITFIGIWAGGIVADESGKKDPQIVVVDEVAGVLLTLAAAPRSTWGIVAAVIAFRFFDIVKPFPARATERLPRGWGIVIDDVVAGGWAVLVLIALRVFGVLS